jgi:hypothetical protein
MIASHILDDNSVEEPAHKQFSESGSEFIWLSWIRIRIRNADPELDSGARQLTKIKKNLIFSLSKWLLYPSSYVWPGSGYGSALVWLSAHCYKN